MVGLEKTSTQRFPAELASLGLGLVAHVGILAGMLGIQLLGFRVWDLRLRAKD